MSLYTARVSGVSLSAATAKTLLQVHSTTKPLRVVELGISFMSISATDVPVAVDLMRTSTDGTSSSLTLVADDDRAESPIATALQTFSAEPTPGNILRTWQLTPLGIFVIQFPLGREPVAYGSRLAIRTTAPQAQTATAYLTFEE